jgi:hypothetical protein
MVGDVPDRTTHELDQLPEESRLRSVTAAPADIAGRQALRVELTDTVTFNGKPGVDYVDMPTFVIIPTTFTDGTIEVDILSRLNGKGPADARAFAGIAYRIAEGGDRFEAVYLRPSTDSRPTRRAHATSARSSTSPIPTGHSIDCGPSTRTGATRRRRHRPR